MRTESIVYDAGPEPSEEVKQKLMSYATAKVTPEMAGEVMNKIIQAARQGTACELNHWECFVLTNHLYHIGAFAFESEVQPTKKETNNAD